MYYKKNIDTNFLYNNYFNFYWFAYKYNNVINELPKETLKLYSSNMNIGGNNCICDGSSPLIAAWLISEVGFIKSSEQYKYNENLSKDKFLCEYKKDTIFNNEEPMYILNRPNITLNELIIKSYTVLEDIYSQKPLLNSNIIKDKDSSY